MAVTISHAYMHPRQEGGRGRGGGGGWGEGEDAWNGRQRYGERGPYVLIFPIGK